MTVDSSHYNFIISCAKIFAIIYDIPVTLNPSKEWTQFIEHRLFSLQTGDDQIKDVEKNKQIIRSLQIELWQPRDKVGVWSPETIDSHADLSLVILNRLLLRIQPSQNQR